MDLYEFLLECSVDDSILINGVNYSVKTIFSTLEEDSPYTVVEVELLCDDCSHKLFITFLR